MSVRLLKNHVKSQCDSIKYMAPLCRRFSVPKIASETFMIITDLVKLIAGKTSKKAIPSDAWLKFKKNLVKLIDGRNVMMPDKRKKKVKPVSYSQIRIRKVILSKRCWQLEIPRNLAKVRSETVRTVNFVPSLAFSLHKYSFISPQNTDPLCCWNSKNKDK